jgi:putative glutamine amidotransferase
MPCPVVGITGRVEQIARAPDWPFVAVAQAYTQAVALGGGAPLVIPSHLGETGLRATFECIDGLVLSGGGDVAPALYDEPDGGLLWRVDEQRDWMELTLTRWALAEGTPLLAICRGIQVLNVAAGGTLVQDVPTQVPSALAHSTGASYPPAKVIHPVEVTAGSRLAALVGAGELGVNSAHHQAVKDVGAGLAITARAPDGVVEGVESLDHAFCIGVQWHPEVMVNDFPVMRRLFDGLAEAARARVE